MDRVLSFFFFWLVCQKDVLRSKGERATETSLAETCCRMKYGVDVNSIQMYSFNQETSGAESKAWEADKKY